MNSVPPTNKDSKREWLARLSIVVTADEGGSMLQAARHDGPLRVQKPFRQEDGSLHVYILHPPGGLVGGDDLEINICCESGARVLFTSPAAGKFYRCLPGYLQRQHTNIIVAENAHVEWLPQETIFFNGAESRLATSVSLADSASWLGWEILHLGRRASGESFSAGSLEQQTIVRRQDRLLHRERLTYQHELMQACWGFNQAHVIGTLVAIPPVSNTINADWAVEAARECLHGPHWGATRRGCTVLVRYLGFEAEECREGFTLVRQRIGETGLFADLAMQESPRIWNT